MDFPDSSVGKESAYNVGSHQKRIPQCRGKGEAPTTIGGGRITFRVKPHAHQTLLECAPGPRDPTETDQSAFYVSHGDTSQQWPAAGTWALGAAELDYTACGMGPLEGGHHCPHHGATEHLTQKLQNNYSKEILALLRKF